MKCNIQYASDLHLEFPANKEYLRQHPLQSVGDVLVLAGDIVPFAVMEEHKDFFSYVSDHFETTYWVPGNHEYYHFDITQKSGVLFEPIRSNVFLVNNTTAVHRGVKLLFSTLWSSISPGYQWQIERGLNDFRLIRHKEFRFSVERFNQLHTESLAFIWTEVNAEKDEKTAVFTHHCPTFFNYPRQHKGSMLNQAFAVELFDLIEASDIACWVFGHHHTNVPEFSIGNTQIVTNQLGYVHLGEYALFNTRKRVEL